MKQLTVEATGKHLFNSTGVLQTYRFFAYLIFPFMTAEAKRPLSIFLNAPATEHRLLSWFNFNLL